MNLSVRAKIVLITFVVILISLVANTIYSSSYFVEEYSKAIQSKSFIEGGVLANNLEKMLKFGIELENLLGFEKQCKNLVDDHEDISFAMVIGMDGKIIFHNDPSKHGKTLTDPKVFEAIKSKGGTTEIHSIESEKFYISFIPVNVGYERHVATVMVGVPLSFIEQKTGSLVLNSILVAGLSMVVAISLLVIVIFVWVTKPLKRLVSIIHYIRKSGDLRKKVEFVSGDEIGQLAYAFNQMITDLKVSQEKLKGYSEDLEKKVAERTKEVEKSKNMLEGKVDELERFSKMTVGRELKMVELKKKLRESENRVRELENQLKEMGGKTGET